MLADKEKDDKVEADDVAVPMDRTQDASKLGRQVAPGESSSSSSSSSSDGQAEHLYSGTQFGYKHFVLAGFMYSDDAVAPEHEQAALLACRTVGSTCCSACTLTYAVLVTAYSSIPSLKTAFTEAHTAAGLVSAALQCRAIGYLTHAYWLSHMKL